MKFLIHTYPKRLWYVEEFLVPSLKAQGAENIEIWNDIEKKGNLRACMESFAARSGNGGTWHLQDDVIICHDFVEQCEEHDDGVVFGFCCRNFNDRLSAYGDVYVPDAWNSFQCVRIPDQWARECADWVFSLKWETESTCPELPILWKLNKGDDTFFHEFMASRYSTETAENMKPNIVDHVDYLVGGSSINYRDYIARAEYFEDQYLIEELAQAIKRRNSR